MPDIRYLTPTGLKKLEEELKGLQQKLKAVSQRIKEAVEMGDLSENAEYHDAKDEQGFIFGRISEIKAVLKNSEVINKKQSDQDVVNVGSTIEVKSDKIKKTFTIVGAEEANPSQGLISNESPFGNAFLGHKKGDKVEVEAPSGIKTFKIVSIS